MLSACTFYLSATQKASERIRRQEDFAPCRGGPGNALFPRYESAQPLASGPTTRIPGPVNVIIHHFISSKFGQRPFPPKTSQVNLPPEPRHCIGLTPLL